MDMLKEIASLPATPGAYVLWLRLSSARCLTVGRRGEFHFPPGDYLYCGSARGPGGLRSRLGRHLMGSKALHWHVDYLRRITEVAGYCYVTDLPLAVPWECYWSHYLVGLPGSIVPMTGFGASDCTSGCLAHCIWLPDGRAGLNSLPGQ
jgi:Uri superfamily endonuclease